MGIDRRDFLNGVAILGAGALTAGLPQPGRGQATPVPAQRAPVPAYPPALTGMRGSHDGSFDVMHSMAWGGKRYGRAATAVDEPYDLVVVGGGLSGLAAARYYQQSQPDARILILDNHDDFGGHARRNEFTVDGKVLIGHGGSQSIDTPSEYSAEAIGLLKDLGVETERFYDYYDRDFYASRGLAMGLFMAEGPFETAHFQQAPVEMLGGFGLMFGAASIGEGEALIETLPLAPADKAKLRELVFEPKDYLAEFDEKEKWALLYELSYTDFLAAHAEASDVLLTLLDDSLKQLYALNWQAVPAANAVDLMMPGTQALGLGPGNLVATAARARRFMPRGLWRWLLDRVLAQDGVEPYIFHFPDGNASLARLLVRKLIPTTASGRTMEDIVLAPLDYARLDTADEAVRCRLNATVVDVRHRLDRGAVDVSYIKDGAHQRVRASHVILACNHQVIPYICDELPNPQRLALDQAERAPLCYINVALRNWRAFAKAGIHRIYAPGSELPHMLLDFPVSMGGVEFSANPDEPILMHISYASSSAQKGDPRTPRELFRAGQHVVYGKSFADFEAAIRSQLSAALGAYGFDADRDIAAITVNRWTHGYAYEPMGHSSELAADDPASPHYAARQQHHRISIANSDAEYSAYVDAAFDAAWRAVEEQRALVDEA
ncbi:MAG: NAD(P)-binding protein [Pseudomonadota bacterium]